MYTNWIYNCGLFFYFSNHKTGSDLRLITKAKSSYHYAWKADRNKGGAFPWSTELYHCWKHFRVLYCHGTFCPNLNPFMAKETEIVWSDSLTDIHYNILNHTPSKSKLCLKSQFGILLGMWFSELTRVPFGTLE